MAAKLGSERKRQGFCAVLLTGKWQAGGRTDGETGGQRLLLFFARTTTATTTRNKKQKEAGKGNASFVNEISRTNNVKVAHTDPRTLTHTHRHTLAQTDARSLSAGSHSPAKSRGRRMHRCEAARQKGQAKGSSSSSSSCVDSDSSVGSSPQKAKANNAVRCVWVQS